MISSILCEVLSLETKILIWNMFGKPERTPQGQDPPHLHPHLCCGETNSVAKKFFQMKSVRDTRKNQSRSESRRLLHSHPFCGVNKPPLWFLGYFASFWVSAKIVQIKYVSSVINKIKKNCLFRCDFKKLENFRNYFVNIWNAKNSVGTFTNFHIFFGILQFSTIFL